MNWFEFEILIHQECSSTQGWQDVDHFVNKYYLSDLVSKNFDWQGPIILVVDLFLEADRSTFDNRIYLSSRTLICNTSCQLRWIIIISTSCWMISYLNYLTLVKFHSEYRCSRSVQVFKWKQSVNKQYEVKANLY